MSSLLASTAAEVSAGIVEMGMAGFAIGVGRRKLEEHDNTNRIIWVYSRGGTIEAASQHEDGKQVCADMAPIVEAHIFGGSDEDVEALIRVMVAAMDAEKSALPFEFRQLDWAPEGGTQYGSKCVLRFVIRYPIYREENATARALAATLVGTGTNVLGDPTESQTLA